MCSPVSELEANRLIFKLCMVRQEMINESKTLFHIT